MYTYTHSLFETHPLPLRRTTCNHLLARLLSKIKNLTYIQLWLCCASTAILYTLTGTAGYYLFTTDTESDVLENFDKDLSEQFSFSTKAIADVVKLGYLGAITVSGQGERTESKTATWEALTRVCIIHMIYFTVSLAQLTFPMINYELRNSIGSLTFSNYDIMTIKRPHFLGKHSFESQLVYLIMNFLLTRFCFCRFCPGLTVAILSVTYLGAVFIPNIKIAFQFTGATAAVLIGK